MHYFSGKVKDVFGKLTSIVPQVPVKRGHSDLNQFRHSLPVYQMGSEIVSKINASKVILIAGETGSGKTTQVSRCLVIKQRKLTPQCCYFFFFNRSFCYVFKHLQNLYQSDSMPVYDI